MALTLDQKFELFSNFSSSVLHSPYNSFPNPKSRWKVQVNVVKPQELKLVCVEANEINGETMFYVRPRRKNSLLLIRFEKMYV